jgi:hypothetical protein
VRSLDDSEAGAVRVLAQRAVHHPRQAAEVHQTLFHVPPRAVVPQLSSCEEQRPGLEGGRVFRVVIEVVRPVLEVRVFIARVV